MHPPETVFVLGHDKARCGDSIVDVFCASLGPTLEDMEEHGRVRRYHEDGGEAHALADQG